MPRLPHSVHQALSWIGHVHTLVWIVESIGGAGVIAVVLAATQRLLHSAVEWTLIVVSFGISSLLFFLALWPHNRKLTQLRETTDSAPTLRSSPPLDRTGIWVNEITAFTIQEARHSVKSPNARYRNVVEVIVTNHCSSSVTVWSPLWDNSTGEAPAQSPLASELDRPLLGYPRRDDELEAWGETADALSVDVGQTIRCSVGLLEPPGEGIKRRLEIRRKGTLILPIKIEGRLAIQRLQI